MLVGGESSPFVDVKEVDHRLDLDLDLSRAMMMDTGKFELVRALVADSLYWFYSLYLGKI
jgi:hypothetical protein